MRMWPIPARWWLPRMRLVLPQKPTALAGWAMYLEPEAVRMELFVPAEFAWGIFLKIAYANPMASSAAARDRSAREEFTREFDKNVPWTAGQAVRLEHRMGSINVHTNQGKEVQIRASLRCSADRLDDAKDFCNRIEIVIQTTGSIFIQTKYPQQDESFWNRRNIGFSVNYDIAMPETAPLAKSTATTRVQRFAISRYSWLPVRSDHASSSDAAAVPPNVTVRSAGMATGSRSTNRRRWPFEMVWLCSPLLVACR